LSVTPGAVRHAGLPLGAANAEVLGGELGLSEDEIDTLRREGVI
jgi:crotonobetainyl-CoA:carnitine CoA-transferase CaiB-like acyl-CoA transferase